MIHLLCAYIESFLFVRHRITVIEFNFIFICRLGNKTFCIVIKLYKVIKSQYKNLRLDIDTKYILLIKLAYFHSVVLHILGWIAPTRMSF